MYVLLGDTTNMYLTLKYTIAVRFVILLRIMSAENAPHPEGLHPYLPVMPDDGGMYFSHTYNDALQESLEGLEPEEEARRRAEIVLTAPTENEAWQAYGLKIGYGTIGYQDVMWDVIKRARQSPGVNEAMLAVLKEHDLSERISEYAAGVLISHCMSDTDHKEAALETVNWVATLLPAESDHHRRVQSAKNMLQERQNTIRLDDQQLALYAASVVVRPATPDYAAAAKEHERHAEEERQKRLARMDFLRKQPFKAFSEIVSDLGIKSPEQANTLDFEVLGELVEVAERIEKQRDTVTNEPDRQAAELATSILETLTSRVQQLAPEVYVKKMIDYTLFRRECGQATGATNEADFWDTIHQLQQNWRATKHKVQVASLYKEWREAYINRREYEVAEQTLESFGISSHEELLSEHIDGVELSVQSGRVEYADFEDLLADMRSYFLLQPARKRLGESVALDRALKSSGGVDAVTMARAINPGGDAALMKDLEKAMRKWQQTGGELFRDPHDHGHGDPYKYSGGVFTGHGISVKRAGNAYTLHLEGRGHCYNAYWPTEYIDSFAAYVGKDVTYSGNVRVAFVGAPPANTVAEERDIIYRGGRVKRKEVVPGQLHIDEIAEKLTSLTGIAPAFKEKIIRLVVSDPDYDQRTISDGDMRVGVETSHLPDNPTFDSGVLNGYLHVVNKDLDPHDDSYFFLPSITFDLIHSDPSFQQTLAGLVHALGVKQKHQRDGWRSYDHGRRGPYNSFVPYAWGAKRYDD